MQHGDGSGTEAINVCVRFAKRIYRKIASNVCLFFSSPFLEA